MFEFDLRDQIPHDNSYGTQEPNWGGAACCQMVMNGYPSGATSCYIDQTTIWNYIQANNKEGGTGPWGIGWYADPYAVTKTLNDLCPPQHHWVDVSGINKEQVLYTLLRWMAKYKYASLVCVHVHDLWRVLVYYKTSDDPQQVTNPEVNLIGFYIPYYSEWLGGPVVDYSEIDGNAWMEGPYNWGLPCNGFYGTPNTCGQIWNGKWVGVGEPPEKEGKVKIEIFSRVGKEVIEPKKASEIARKFVASRIRDKTKFISRYFFGIQDSKPMLVRELPIKNVKENVDKTVHYYIVPFINKYEVNRKGDPITRLSVLINAYTGQFEELRIFSRPVRYLSEEEALNIAKRNLRLNQSELQELNTELVFSPIHPYIKNVLPAWKFKVKEKTIFITQNGLIVGGFYFPTYRGG
ncbi:MAG: hypothetical protein ACFFBY_13805 [Promethearchaeota archaeon]